MFAEKYDLAIVLRNSSWCNLLAFLSGAKYRAGNRAEAKRFSLLLTHYVKIAYPKATRHEIDRNMDIVRLVGAVDGDHSLILRLSEEERTWAEDFLRNADLDDKRTAHIIGIHPGGSSADKLWSPEKYAAAANQLAKKYQAKIMVFGGPDDGNAVDRIQEALEQKPIIANRLMLRQFAALVEKCSLFLCNDSGPMHIASALKVPTVAVFGPTDYVRWSPRGAQAVVVRRDLGCFPCSAHKCKKNYECIRSIPASEVIDAGSSLLDRSRQ